MAFMVSTPYNQTPQYEPPAKDEKPTKTVESDEIARKMKSLEKNIKNIQGLGGHKSVSFNDLCMFPHIHLPPGFKTPKFEKYDVHGDPITHLKRYCNQLRGAGGKEELLMDYFGESLVGVASEWFIDQDISQWHADHVNDLKRFFEQLRRYDLKLNPAKCVFGVPSGKLLSFTVSRRDIKLDPSKIKSIRDLPPPKNNKEWTDDCQNAFDRIKDYLSKPPVLVPPPEPGRPLFLYLSVIDNSFGCVLGKHEAIGKKEQAIYYLSKKFTNYEIHGDLIHSPPSELHHMTSPWPFVAWGMDVIGPIEPKATNGHRFIVVAIDYFTKWVKAVIFKAFTKKAVVDFVHSNIICCFANGAVEVANKNIKNILRKLIQGSRQWHEKLPFALLGYRTTARISVGATSYLLVYETEAVIQAEVEIPSLRIIVESKIKDAEWVKTRLEQLMLIDEKRQVAVCFGQLY
ncbi:uncharacterized protein [Nicotiana tomentosiformis]|uniref:uncharacterized protein n=1 Tax=Nicotiana tomentosiformis TaxID=4098 RepID=UPI00388CDC83